MTMYRVEFTVHATAYIRADSKGEAMAKASNLSGVCMEDVSGELFCGLRLAGPDSPDLPEVSLSPAMTIGQADYEHMEEVE
jgi:hypothetical protein